MFFFFFLPCFGGNITYTHVWPGTTYHFCFIFPKMIHMYFMGIMLDLVITKQCNNMM